MSKSKVVAVTGANGHIGSFVVRELLSRGHTVRAVVRDPSNEEKTKHLKALAEETGNAKVHFYAGDLYAEGSFDAAFEGCDAVVHTAAVVSLTGDPKTLYKASVEGTKNVLASVDRAKTVQRLVHTSSIAAVQRLDDPDGVKYTEDDEATSSSFASGDPYGYSKLSAERVVRAHAKNAHYDVVVLCPGVCLGPCMTKVHSKASPAIVRQFIYGNTQLNYHMSPVDIRDVAYAHAQALDVPSAGGERFILVNTKEAMFMPEVARKVAALFPQYKVTTTAFTPMWQIEAFERKIPLLFSLVTSVAFMLGVLPAPDSIGGERGLGLLLALVAVLLFAVCTPRPVVNTMTRRRFYDNTKSQDVLGVKYTAYDTTLKDTFNSLATFVKVKENKKKA